MTGLLNGSSIGISYEKCNIIFIGIRDNNYIPSMQLNGYPFCKTWFLILICSFYHIFPIKWLYSTTVSKCWPPSWICQCQLHSKTSNVYSNWACVILWIINACGCMAFILFVHLRFPYVTSASVRLSESMKVAVGISFFIVIELEISLGKGWHHLDSAAAL